MPARVYGYAIGTFFLLLGVFGFVVTGFEGFVASDTDGYVFWFQLNPTHNFAHFLLGAAMMWGAATGPGAARIVVGTVGVVYVGLGIAGFWLTGMPDWNVLALNLADNVLHLATGATALVAALLPASEAAPAR